VIEEHADFSLLVVKIPRNFLVGWHVAAVILVILVFILVSLASLAGTAARTAARTTTTLRPKPCTVPPVPLLPNSQKRAIAPLVYKPD
jgi:hypothetical protein